jgi:hypothetical protein
MELNPPKEKTTFGEVAFQNNLANLFYQKHDFKQENFSISDYAVRLAQHGIPVFPCLENKAPACSGGFKSATTDITTIKEIWANPSAVLVGVPTGELSGFSVLDIDPRHGGDKWLADNEHKLPPTRKQQTRSGGVHLLFKHQSGLRNSAGKIASGVDIRGDGGYIIWWAACGLPVLCDEALAEFPDWLLDMLKPKPHPIIKLKPSQKIEPICKANVNGTGYASAALFNAAQNVATAPEGRRNDTLNKELWSLLRFVKSDELHVQEIANTLVSAALSAGLTSSEIQQTLRSARLSRGLSC